MARLACPVCGTGRLVRFLEIPSVPVYCNVLWPSREEARAAPRGRMGLGFCSGCALVYNMDFDEALVAYTPAYENSLHASPRFRAYAEGLARELIETYGLCGKTIVEIGCGKGEFLAILCRDGRNRGIGFDSSYDGRVDHETGGSIRIIRDHYSERYADEPADLICSRHVLEHVPEPAAFMRAVRRGAEGAGGAPVFLEVPNGIWTLRDLGIWDLIYEHCSYFTPPSLESLLVRSGFDAEPPCDAFGGQYLYVRARPGTGAGGRREPSPGSIEQVRGLVQGFAGHFREKLASWRERLAGLHAAGRRTAIWGVGSKGVTFANLVPEGRETAAAIDINPRKVGLFLPGTGHRVTAPASVQELAIDTVLVMNPLYEQEIRAELDCLGSRAEVIPV